MDPEADYEGCGGKSATNFSNYRKCQFWQYRYFALPEVGQSIFLSDYNELPRRKRLGIRMSVLSFLSQQAAGN